VNAAESCWLQFNTITFSFGDYLHYVIVDLSEHPNILFSSVCTNTSKAPGTPVPYAFHSPFIISTPTVLFMITANLDFENTTSYNLELEVSDGSRTGFINIKVSTGSEGNIQCACSLWLGSMLIIRLYSRVGPCLLKGPTVFL
jgi:hypothetical protein